MKHTNPIDFKNENYRDYGDPFVLRHNGVYYLYFTAAGPEGLPFVYSSLDLIHWTNEGETTFDENAICAFAPEVIYAFGKFYMVTSPRGKGHYVFVSSSPKGPFTRLTDNIGSMIDGSLFVSSDNKLHFLRASSSGIVLLDMDENGDISNHRLISDSLDGWTEGPSLLNLEGKYYLFYCGNHYCATGYRVQYAVSDTLDGPYVDGINNPLVINTDSNVSKLGHSSEVLAPDLCSYLIFYHGMANKKEKTKRVVNFDRLFISDGQISVTPTFFEVEKYKEPAFAKMVSDEETVFESGIPAKKEFVLEAYMDKEVAITFGDGYSFLVKGDQLELRHNEEMVGSIPNHFDFTYPHTVRLENKEKLYVYIDTANVGSFPSIVPTKLGYMKEKGDHLGSFSYSFLEDMRFKKTIPGYFSKEVCEGNDHELKLEYVAEEKAKYEVSLLIKGKEASSIRFNGVPYLVPANPSEFSSLFYSLDIIELEKEGGICVDFEKDIEIKGIKIEKVASFEDYSTLSSEEEADKYELSKEEGDNHIGVTFLNPKFTPYSEAGILFNVTSFSKDTIQCRHHLNGLFVGFRNRLLVINDYRYKETRVFDKPFPIEEGKEYRLEVTYKNSCIEVYLDGVLINKTYYPSLNTFGRVGLYKSEYSKVVFKDFKSRRDL